ncbi:protein claret segregational-like [Teleopsis dalmanni]|uniref:protein claret segregational-like n=1 Tax=Teleopsis dalmanni TaxID=139649 RepID=UPI0018CFB67E|nr:protein claret segregational-like [Teleopsis dalmanni]
MESKLPKPSGLKRPLQISRIPTDRIKTNTFGTVKTIQNSTLPPNNYQPLSRDLSNIPSNFTKRDRGVSPEFLRKPTTENRAKLRRSKSACDLREMNFLKRNDVALGSIAAKSSRLANINANAAVGGTQVITRPARMNTFNATSTASIKKSTSNPTSAIHKTTKRAASAPVSNVVSKKPTPAGSSVTSVSTTGPGKTINKRIPAYDYKARYNDLLEKYKVLKQNHEEKCELMGEMETLPEQLEESQAQLYETKEQLKNAQTDIQCLERQVKSQAMKIETLSNSLVKTKEQLQNLEKEHTRISKEHSALSTEVVELRETKNNLTITVTELTEESRVSKEQLFRSNMERKELHNMVMDLRGNIRVFCRVRPSLPCEEDKMLCGWNYLDEATLEIYSQNDAATKGKVSHTFGFDQVFHPCSRQSEIFEMVSPLIQSALDGYNICIFAYGQTGSGKTYTMDGVQSNPGVIPRTVDLLFESIKNYKRLGWKYEIKVTFLEIYNEVLYDLLSNEQKEMEIRMATNNKYDIYVSNITEETVTTASRLRELMNLAKMNRATASTVGNERSSRSHAVTKIELTGIHEDNNEMSVGTINLVDLAGSESPKTSTRMTETKNINRSLSELTNVILALLQKQDHIPYRNSKLTHLLMPSLGGNSKTLMFINVAPFQDCFVESLKSLRFAASVNSCKMTKAKRNRVLNSSTNNIMNSLN